MLERTWKRQMRSKQRRKGLRSPAHCRLEQKAKALAEKAANKASEASEAGTGKGCSHFAALSHDKHDDMQKHSSQLKQSSIQYTWIVNWNIFIHISGFKGHLKWLAHVSSNGKLTWERGSRKKRVHQSINLEYPWIPGPNRSELLPTHYIILIYILRVIVYHCLQRVNKLWDCTIGCNRFCLKQGCAFLFCAPCLLPRLQETCWLILWINCCRTFCQLISKSLFVSWFHFVSEYFPKSRSRRSPSESPRLGLIC